MCRRELCSSSRTCTLVCPPTRLCAHSVCMELLSPPYRSYQWPELHVAVPHPLYPADWQTAAEEVPHQPKNNSEEGREEGKEGEKEREGGRG